MQVGGSSEGEGRLAASSAAVRSLIVVAALVALLAAGEAIAACKEKKPPLLAYTMQQAIDACHRGEHSAVAMILDIQAPQLLADNPNDGEARYCLGVAYLDGADYRGKPRYRAKAIEWLREAATLKYPGAQQRQVEAEGQAGVVSDNPAVRHLSAAEAACAPNPRGGLCHGNATLAAWHYRQAVEYDSALAMLALSDMYARGHGVVRSEATARRLVDQAVRQAHPEAMRRAAERFARGVFGADQRFMGYALYSLRVPLVRAGSMEEAIAVRDSARSTLTPPEIARAERYADAAWLVIQAGAFRR